MRGGSRFVPRRVEPGVLAVMVVVALSATRAWEESRLALPLEELDFLATEETAEYEREVGGGGGVVGVPSSRPPTSSTIPETTPAAAATTTP